MWFAKICLWQFWTNLTKIHCKLKPVFVNALVALYFMIIIVYLQTKMTSYSILTLARPSTYKAENTKQRKNYTWIRMRM